MWVQRLRSDKPTVAQGRHAFVRTRTRTRTGLLRGVHTDSLRSLGKLDFAGLNKRKRGTRLRGVRSDLLRGVRSDLLRGAGRDLHYCCMAADDGRHGTAALMSGLLTRPTARGQAWHPAIRGRGAVAVLGLRSILPIRGRSVPGRRGRLRTCRRVRGSSARSNG